MTSVISDRIISNITSIRSRREDFIIQHLLQLAQRRVDIIHLQQT